MTLTGIGLPTWGASDIGAACPPRAAIDALRRALQEGLDPSKNPARTHTSVSAGHLLLMPAEHGRYAGVKIAGVAPGNPDRGLPRITGLYVLLAADTLRPVALLDGEQLTLTRTAAVSALAVDHLAVPDARRLTLYGTGPQALAHAEAIHSIRAVEHIDVIGRRPEGVQQLVDRCRSLGLPAASATQDALRHADIVACCTSASQPLFDGAQLTDHATVVAMGSHSPEQRETDDTTITRSLVVVEDTATALREAGDIAIPARRRLLDPDRLITLADLVRMPQPPAGGPRFFKSVGMSWQDLVIAAHVYDNTDSGPADD
ncbi:ornithine cyclodeaminase family protein [Streptomyces sp. NPDC000888]